MAKTTFASIGVHQILEEIGDMGPVTMITTPGTIYPGSVVTVTGETLNTPTCDLAGAADEFSSGIAGLLPNWDIGTVYPAGTSIPVHTRGSRAKAWTHMQAAQADAKMGTPLNHTAASADGYVLVGELRNEHVGELARDCDSHATNDVPCLVHLI